MVLEFGFLLESFLRDFLQYLTSNLTSIPFTVSIGAAVLLTIMYLASFISSTIIKMLLLPSYTFVAITYFFPTLIPAEHEFVSLILFAGMIGITAIFLRHYRKTRKRTRLDKAIFDILTWMETAQILNPNRQLENQMIRNRIKIILKKNKIL